MTTELAPKYAPAEIEPQIAKLWNDANAFHAEPPGPNNAAAEVMPSFCIVIPPPNVTGALHMGHALNNTLQDILIRWHRMMGDNTLWMPGTDHAGIATQTVVEKRVLEETGRRRTFFTREEFVQKIQKWKDEYEQRILGQLKAMGCSCDWDRTRFTMDDVCAKAVREAFFQLFKAGLIYRGKRLVNWDPATETALADDEVEMKEIDGNFYYLKYPLVPVAPGEGPGGRAKGPADKADVEYVTVATTRPETMLGDTAVAINPRDPRAAALRGRFVKLPIVNRIIPIIEDDYVVLSTQHGGDASDSKAQFATGFLKVTPAHDPNDYEIGMRHKERLGANWLINIFAPDAFISFKHGWSEEDRKNADPFLESLDQVERFEARKMVVKWFREQGMLEDMKPYKHSVGHSYRSHVPIEPYLSDQWYVATKRGPRAEGGKGPAEGIEKFIPGTDVPPDSLAGLALRAMQRDQRAEVKSERAATVRERSSLSSVAPSTPNSITHTPTQAHTVCFISFTCYGTWLHGDQRGSVDRNHNLVGTPDLSEDERREQDEFNRLKHEPVQLDEERRRIVGDAIAEVCAYRGWTMFEGQVRSNHVHTVVQIDVTPERALNDFKSYATRALNKANLSAPDSRNWTRHGSTRYLNDDKSIEAACQYVREQEGGPLAGAEIRPLPHGRGSSEPTANAERAATVREWSSDSSSASAPWEGNLTFHPPRYAQTFEAWHQNIRDWCISRQIWWGHRIPVWHWRARIEDGYIYGEHSAGAMAIAQSRPDCALVVTPAGKWEPINIDFNDEGDPDKVSELNGEYDFYVCLQTDDESILGIIDAAREHDGTGFEQDPDVLDTWFSSALWPISTLGWPDENPALKTWNPSNVLSTARDIITLWVSRMTMFNLFLRDRLPFTDVFIHATILDGEGQRMSKSKGNGVDPLDIIHSHGSDAMRFTLAIMSTNTQDVRLPVLKDPTTGKNSSDKFDSGRNFANKLWNAVRFALSNLEETGDAISRSRLSEATPALADKWILSRLAATVRDVDTALANYEFSVYAQTLYDFIWRDLCDWYIEAIKPTVKTDPVQRRVLALCIDASLRMLHPVMPYITEKLYQRLNDVVPIREVSGVSLFPSGMLVHAAWPQVAKGIIDQTVEEEFGLLQAIVTAVRQVRTTYKIPPRQKLKCTAKAPAPKAQKLLALRDLFETLAVAEGGEIGPRLDKPADAAVAMVGDVEIYVHGVIQADAEKSRLTKRLDEVAKNVAALEGRLNSKSYVDRAPANLVQQTRDQLDAAKKELAAIKQQLAELKGRELV